MKPTIKTYLPILFLIFTSVFTQAQTDDFEIIKKRVIAEIMKGDIDDARVKSILEKTNDDGSFQGIDYEDLSRTAGFPHRRHTENMVYLAKAYKTKSSDFYKSKKVMNDIVKELQYWVDHDFFGDNWHDNQISTPTNLENLMLIIGDDLPKDLVEKACFSWATGKNSTR